jgi:predicted protein tyrosine phosphatase
MGSAKIMLNRLANVHNKYQDLIAFPRTLCVCSAALLRSPTIGFVTQNPPYNRNSRAAGIVNEYALIPVDQVLLEWADEIICVEEEHKQFVEKMLKKFEIEDKTIYLINVPDNFKYRDQRLINLIQKELERVGFPKYQGK